MSPQTHQERFFTEVGASDIFLEASAGPEVFCRLYPLVAIRENAGIRHLAFAFSLHSRSSYVMLYYVPSIVYREYMSYMSAFTPKLQKSKEQ